MCIDIDFFFVFTTIVFLHYTKPLYFPENKKTVCMRKDNTEQEIKMSTPATWNIGGITFYQSSDGYPDDIIPMIQGMITEAKEKAERNPDFTWLQLLIIAMKDDFVYDEYCNGFPSEYSYYIDDNDNVVEDKD